MSYLKISPNLFLEKQELDRLVKFLDTDGFRQFLVDNSATFGFIKKPNEAFTNGLVTEDTGYTVKFNEVNIIDSNGNLVHSDAVTELAVPNDNLWYWIKITQAYSSQEVGTYSIDTAGNLTCTSGDGELLTILRGQPNYPSRVRFLNAASNLLEYDVEEVVDNNNAVLTGSFTAETDLTLSVVGTFTAGYVPLTSEKNIFQYDSSTVSLVQSSTTTEPSHTTGLDFFLARVKRNGSSLLIEDRRNDIWTTNANYYIRHVDLIGNPLIGVEQITFDDQFTPRDKNILEIAWAFRAVTFAVDLKNNKITISAGSGGIFKNTNFDTQFTDGDFDGWRLYTKDGKYYSIQTSSLNAGTIELNLDNLNATSFYSDINSTTPIDQILLVTPEAEEIEIICSPDPDSSDSTSAAQHGLNEIRKVFPINSEYGRIHLTVYHETAADYTITYRYKHLLHYGPVLILPNDSTGYYNENQFNVHGRRIGSTRTTYSSGIVTLILSTKAYNTFQTGDVHGVDTIQLANANAPVIHLTVGSNKQYQRYSGTSLVLSGDLSINLMSTDVDGAPLKDGASFMLHFEQLIDLNSNSFKIVYNYTTTPVTLKEFNVNDTNFLLTHPKGLFFLCTWDATNDIWIINAVNEVKDKQTVEIYSTTLGGAINSGFNVNFTNYPTWATIPSLTITTPNDGVTRNYLVLFKTAFSISNGVNDAIADFRISDGSTQLDFARIRQIKNTATDVVYGTATMERLALSVAPNTTIVVQVIGYTGAGDINCHDLKFTLLEV